MALAKPRASRESLATEKGPVMERHVEERFERIEYILEETAKNNREFSEQFKSDLEDMRKESKEFRREAKETLDDIFAHLKLCAQILQDTDSLSRETANTVDALRFER